MKSPINSPLDSFFTDALKNSAAHPVIPDWSEVEVLLKREQKTIPIKMNRKSAVIVGSMLVVVLAGIGIFKLVKYYSSLPAENEMVSDATQQTILTAVDTQKNISPDTSHPVTADINSSEQEIDSVAVAIQEKKADSLIADFKEKEKKRKDSIAEIKTTKDKTAAQKEPKKNEKKTKISSLAPTISDSDNSSGNILPPDTSGKNKNEMKIDSPVKVDSSKITPSPKNKKGKKQKTTSPDSSKVTSPSPVKSDSLR